MFLLLGWYTSHLFSSVQPRRLGEQSILLVLDVSLLRLASLYTITVPLFRNIVV